MRDKQIREIRAFNRFYTDIIGLLNQNILDSPWSLAEARVIYEIFKGRSITATRIIEIMHVDKSYLSRLIKKLEKEKIVTKKQSGQDGRILQLSLTQKGTKTFESLDRASDNQIATLLQSLTEGQCEDLSFHMRAIQNILKK
jgi:DNA-binding MarR family transcriptional regulator